MNQLPNKKQQTNNENSWIEDEKISAKKYSFSIKYLFVTYKVQFVILYVQYTKCKIFQLL